MALLKKLKDKTGTVHDLGDSRIDALETELSGAEHNVPYSPAVLAKTNAIETSISEHVGNTANPHKVNKSQIGLANVENKSSTQIRSELTKENVTNALGYTPIDESRIGAANGVASLDASGRIPASQIPGGFDNIEEYDKLAAFPTTGEEGKIYVAKDTNLTYRWTGSQYVEISPSLALGETATTAYRGDRGKVAYTHSQVSGNSTIHHTHANKEVLDGINSDKVTYWDGKEDAFDVLPLSKGGTGATNKSAAEYNIIGLTSIEKDIGDDSKLALLNPNVSSSNGVIRWLKASYIWTYIKSKISSVLGLTASAYSGKSATAGTADKAVSDNSGNDIEETYAKKTELSTHTGDTTVHITAAERTAWNAKQAALTFDTTPKASSNNPVTSGGIKMALDLKANDSDLSKHTSDTTVHITAAERTAWNAKQAALTFDTTPKASSNNPVTSGGIKTALDLKANDSDLSKHTSDTTVHITAAERTAWNAKQAALTFDTTPKAGSNNPVTSGGIKTALDLKANDSDLSKHTSDTTVHITAAERTAWNAKASTSVATTSANGLMSKTDKSKLDGISSGSNKADVSYASAKLIKTIDGTSSDVFDASEIITDTNTFGNFASVTDVTVSSVVYHTYWKVAPTSSNQVYGFAVHPTNGKLYRVYNNKGSYSVYSFDTNTTYTFDGTYNASSNKAATVSSITSRIETAKNELDAAINTVDEKGIVINEIDGENVICFE